MESDAAQALRAEGLDPDDPAVIAAIDLVRWELSLHVSDAVDELLDERNDLTGS
jgi:hypothetical protein